MWGSNTDFSRHFSPQKKPIAPLSRKTVEAQVKRKAQTRYFNASSTLTIPSQRGNRPRKWMRPVHKKSDPNACNSRKNCNQAWYKSDNCTKLIPNDRPFLSHLSFCSFYTCPCLPFAPAKRKTARPPKNKKQHNHIWHLPSSALMHYAAVGSLKAMARIQRLRLKN